MIQYQFRDEYYMSIHQSTTKDIGVFDYEIELLDITTEITQEMINWCAKTCNENFIIYEIKDRVVAGGHMYNYQAWKNGLFNVKKKWTKQNSSYTLFIRLSKKDFAAFNLGFADEITTLS